MSDFPFEQEIVGHWFRSATSFGCSATCTVMAGLVRARSGHPRRADSKTRATSLRRLQRLAYQSPQPHRSFSRLERVDGRDKAGQDGVSPPPSLPTVDASAGLSTGRPVDEILARVQQFYIVQRCLIVGVKPQGLFEFGPGGFLFAAPHI